MTDDDLLAHLKDILNCCGVSRAQTTIGGMDRLRLAVNMAVAEERERCARVLEQYNTIAGLRTAAEWARDRMAEMRAELAEQIRNGLPISPAGG